MAYSSIAFVIAHLPWGSISTCFQDVLKVKHFECRKLTYFAQGILAKPESVPSQPLDQAARLPALRLSGQSGMRCSQEFKPYKC